MLGLPDGLFPLFAQAAPAAGGQQPPSLLMQLLPFLPAIPIFYFLLLRPQQQMEKKRREMIQNLKKNDKVVTASGMYGTVLSVDEAGDRVVLRLDDDGKVKITFTKASIVKVLGEPAAKSAEAK